MVTKTIAAITLNFIFEKETKNCIRFQEVVQNEGDRGIVGTLYILKEELPDDIKNVQVVITPS